MKISTLNLQLKAVNDKNSSETTMDRMCKQSAEGGGGGGLHYVTLNCLKTDNVSMKMQTLVKSM